NQFRIGQAQGSEQEFARMDGSWEAALVVVSVTRSGRLFRLGREPLVGHVGERLRRNLAIFLASRRVYTGGQIHKCPKQIGVLDLLGRELVRLGRKLLALADLLRRLGE